MEMDINKNYEIIMMNKYAIYQELRKLLPLVRPEGQNFIDFVKLKMQEYIDIVNPLYYGTKNFNVVKKIIDSLPEIFKEQFNHNEKKAYSIFKDVFIQLSKEDGINGYKGILPIFGRDYMVLNELNQDKLNYYFRLTKFEDSIIHLPFHKRGIYHLNNRFTDPNIPCFYGGNSILCCLDELGCELNDEELLISCFEISYPNMGVLDLTMPKFNVEQSDNKYLDNFILSWPIISLCMIRKLGNATKMEHRPEYILPQFILKFLSKREVLNLNAVRYYSTKKDDLTENYINIAIPAQTQKNYGYCDTLLNFFKDDDRDPLNPNYLKITRPKKLSDLIVNHKSNLLEIENKFKENISYQKDLFK